jgi:hypothetical protein
MPLADSGILVAVRVSSVQAQLLRFVAERGAEISWDWSACRLDVVEMTRDLVTKGLVTDLVASRRLRLTDQGRSAVSQIEHAAAKVQVIQSM